MQINLICTNEKEKINLNEKEKINLSYYRAS